jgi:hypothetical protein
MSVTGSRSVAALAAQRTVMGVRRLVLFLLLFAALSVAASRTVAIPVLVSDGPYSFTHDGVPVGWGCRVPVYLARAGAPVDAEQLVERSLARYRELTGIDFDLTVVDDVDSGQFERAQRRGIAIVWQDPDMSSLIGRFAESHPDALVRATDRSVGGSVLHGLAVAQPAVSMVRGAELFSAVVVINTGTAGVRNTPGALTEQLIVTHEIGHALGLGHAEDPDDLMADNASPASPEGRFTVSGPRLVALYVTCAG